jgi:DNA-directed RNA polymerase subunit RPC12/RpoP
MIYRYMCNKCGKRKEESFKMGDALDYIECDCGGKMKQDILGKKIQTHLPLDYRATETDYHSVNYGDDYSMEKMLSV